MRTRTTGSMAGRREQTSAVAPSCTASRMQRSSLYASRRGPSRSSSSACACAQSKVHSMQGSEHGRYFSTSLKTPP